MNEAIYLYGFVPRGTRPPAEDLAGVADAPVEVVDGDGFGMAIGRVPADRYAASVVEARLRDLEWVGAQGLRHERVVAWFVDHGQIVPVRLLTLYSSLDALAREAAERADEIRDRLRRFAGRREWDLKVSYRAERVAERLGGVSEAVRSLDAEIAAAAPGRRFLLERRRAELARTEVVRVSRRLATELLDGLRDLVIETKLLPPPKAAAALPVVVNAALLVPEARESAVRRVVGERAAELAECGLHVDFSGPWAPYRFLGGDA